jgi:hypothetical protein
MPGGDLGLVMDYCAFGSLKSFLKALPQVSGCAFWLSLHRITECMCAHVCVRVCAVCVCVCAAVG